MLQLIIDLGLELFQIISVIILALYFIIRTGVFNRTLQGNGSAWDKILLILFFGALSVYGMMSKLTLFGSTGNVRDLGPVIAGLTFGPLVGFGTAVIGAAFRYSLGGITVIPCTLVTLIAGLLAGGVWYYNKKKYIGTLYAVIFIFFLQVIHLTLIIMLAGTGPDVVAIIQNMWAIMLPLYIVGIIIYSIMFENYQAEQKSRDDLVQKKVELHSAQEIQNSFLPKIAPDIPGYDLYASTTPAREVGGDFFDYLLYDDGRIALIIADVSEKSIPAALFMALSSTIVRVAGGWIQLPNQAVSEINNLINRYAESGMFFSMVYGILSPKEGTISYVNAGHPPPVLLRKDGSIEELHRTGSIIGYKPDRVYPEASVQMNQGDILVCYTDGVTEPHSDEGTLFGKERLVDLIQTIKFASAEGIADRIREEIRTFTKDAPQYDDITLLIVKRN